MGGSEEEQGRGERRRGVGMGWIKTYRHIGIKRIGHMRTLKVKAPVCSCAALDGPMCVPGKVSAGYSRRLLSHQRYVIMLRLMAATSGRKPSHCCR